MKIIKYSVGQRVFWLSRDGFRRGVVKSVAYVEDESSRRLTYRLTTHKYNKMYMGDDVPEELIFTSYTSMIIHYEKQYAANS